MGNAMIYRQIRKKEGEIRSCERVMEQVNREIKVMNDQVADWEVVQRGLNQEEMTNSVVVQNCFEGLSAKETQGRFFDFINYKQSKNRDMGDTIEDSQELEQNIGRRIEELEEEIEELYERLDEDEDSGDNDDDNGSGLWSDGAAFVVRQETKKEGG